MSSQRDDNHLAKSLKEDKDSGKGEPEWASGLKHLYDSVVDEPLPDSFKDLLSQLDGNGGK